MTSNLINLDPDRLFELRSVQEVEGVLKSVDVEIEKKVEELRMLVGERYRDLIEAADTIRTMKEISEDIIQDVDHMNVEMKALQKRLQSNTFKSDPVLKERVTAVASDSVAAQISILVELPELIWSSIAQNDYLRATQLFILGRHIKTGFSVDKSLKVYASNLPILERQWSTLSYFSNTILQNVENELRQIDLTPEMASTCLASVALLQNKCIVSSFLSLRSEALEEILSCNDDVLLEAGKDVRARMLNSCQCVLNSLSVLHSSFLEPWEQGNGLVWRQLHFLVDGHKPVQLLGRNIAFGFLPAIVTQFKVSPLTNSSSVDFKQLESKVESWLGFIRETLLIKGRALLKKIKSLHKLNALKSDYSRSDIKWENLLKTFNVQKKFNLWEGVYNPLFSERAKELITSQCNETFNSLVNNIKAALQEKDPNQLDQDLRWFVWKESPEDLEFSNDSPRGILLKAKGITPKVSKICFEFENKLSSLYNDLSGLYNEDDMLSADDSHLRKHQQDACSSIILRLKEVVRSLVSEHEKISEGTLSIVARLLQAISELCPTLHNCLMLGDPKGNAWHELKMLLHSESVFCWSLWEAKVLMWIERVLAEGLTKPETYADLLNSVPEWDVCWIEETSNEEGDQKSHKSQLRVPSGPSLPLQNVLCRIITFLRRAHLPRLINESLMQKALPLILDCYDTSSILCQAQALQNLFDVKYVSMLYIPPINKDLNGLCHQKLSSIEEHIDPIDLEVYSPLIRDKVKLSTSRTTGLLGISFPSDDLTSSGVAKAQPTTNDEDERRHPSVIPLSKSASTVWFQPFLISNPVSRSSHLTKSKASKLTKVMSDSESSKSAGASSSFISYWFS